VHHPAPSPVTTGPSPAPGFVHAERGRIVGPDGEPLLLRGVGLGNWLLPEGYMWGFGERAASPRQIEAVVAALIGEEDAAAFWRRFRDVFVTADDVAAIAAWGFDHVRLPINWRVLARPDGAWREDGFALVDRLVGWCRDAGLRVLLDLHGAPGGQTGTNIDDSSGRPELFMDARNQDLTVALWTELARRHAGDPTVLGYDLLNEPLPNEWQHVYADDLVVLYRRLTAAIRAVDPDHLIMYEGTHWATGWDVFTEVWDPNSVLQFHKYWSPADLPSIRRFLETGARLGLPVYMGEGGENVPEWLAAAHQLYEDHGIGWNLWTWKKVETATSPLSVDAPEGWADVVAFANGTGPRPPRERARRILDDLLANMPADRCTRRPEVVAAVFRRAPVTLPAYGYTFRGAGTSFGTTADAPLPGVRGDEPVALRRRDGGPVPDFSHPRPGGADGDVVADLAPGDWLAFEAEVGPGDWRVEVLGSSTEPPRLTVAGRAVPLAAAGAEGPDAVWRGELTRSEGGRVGLRVAAGAAPLTLRAVRVAA